MKSKIVLNCVLAVIFIGLSHSINCQNVTYTPLFNNSTFTKTINVTLPVGTVAGSSDVSNGAGSYSIPIVSPSGTNGLSPSIALVYSSMSGNGSLGIGWNIQGLSMITRVQKNIYFDGAVHPVKINNTDVFSIDGERMLSKSGTYGANLSTYGKESDDFSTITSYGTFGDGPEHFKLEAKDGTIYEYGNTSTSRFLSNDLTKVFYWRLNRILYKDGNYIDFDYHNFSSESRVKEIRYTGNINTGLSPYSTITFLYGIRDDKNTTYEAGTPIKSTELVTNIIVKTDGNVLFKEYELKYGHNNTSSFIKEIIEKGSDGIGLNSTIFKYGDLPTNFSTSTTTVGQNFQQHFLNGDVNGDGYSDFIGLNNSVVNNIVYTQSFTIYEKSPSELNTNFTAVHTETLPANTYEVFVPRDWTFTKIHPSRGLNHSRSCGDWNGDGRSDIILTKTTGTGSSKIMNEFKVYASPNYTTPITIFPYSNGNKIHTSGNYYLMGDFNGDTKMDMLNMLSSNGSLFKTSVYYGDWPYWLDCGVSGTTHFTESDWPSCDALHVLDFNGDGKDDIMLIKDGSCEIMTFTDLQTAERIYFGGFPTKWHHLFFGDWNGDGKTDMLTRTDKSNNNAPWYKSISTGSGWIETPFTFSKIPDINNAYFGDQLMISDYNADGKTDIAHCWNYWSGSNYYSKIDMYYSKGDNFYSEQYLLSNNIMSDPKYIFTWDSNGDGIPEILNPRGYTNPKQLLYIKKEGKEKLLHKIKNGFDHDIEYVYKRMTQTPNFYTRGAITSYPLNNLQMPMYLVSELKSENGINGMSSTTFSYNEAKFHRQGKSFLGFKTVTNINATTGFKTEAENEFNTTYYITQPKKVSKYLNSTNALLNETFNTNEVVTYVNTKRFWSRVTGTYEKRAFEGQFISSSLTFDTYGNTTNSTTYINNTAATHINPIETKVISAQYGQFGTPIPAKLTSETVTNTRQGQTAYTFTTTFGYNTIGQLTSKTDFSGLPKQVVTTFAYNTLGNQTSLTISPSSMTARTSTQQYDTKGRFVISSTNPLNQTTTYVNDVKWGKPTSITDFTNITLNNTYDAFGRLLNTVDPQRSITVSRNYSWDFSGVSGSVHKKTLTHPGKPDEIIWYDILDRVRRKDNQVFGGGWTSQFTTYDIKGNVSTTTLPYKTGETVLTTTNIYDIYNRISTVSNSIGTTSYSYSYSGGNLTTTVTNPANQVKSNITDPAGRMISATDYGGTLNYTYYSHGKVKDVIQNSQTLTSSVYDAYARQTQLVDIDAGTTQYTTDALGQITGMTTATSQSYIYSYDIMGRKTYYGRPEGSSSYTYYPSGSGGATNELNTVSTYGGKTEQFNYDAYGRVSSKVETVDAIPHTTTFTYNIYDDITSQTYPSGFVANFNYDSNGFLTNIKNGNNTVTLYTQTSTNGLGNTTAYSMGNGKSSTISYHFGIPTNYSTTGIQNLAFTWNYASGNLTSRNDLIKGKLENFTYDNLNRLLTSSGTGLTSLTNTYNTNGNISTKTDAGTYSYGSAKIHAVTQVTNSQSNISLNVQDIAYTSFYQPLSIVEGINRIDFTYASDDQRVKSVRQQNSLVVNTRYYFGDYEKDITSGTTRHIHYILTPSGLGCIVERVGTTDTYHYTYTDHIGSILTVTNSSGVVEIEQNFDAWGRNRNSSTWTYSSITAPPVWLYRGFTGHEHLPQVGLINMNGRLYDPLVGRMLSPDNNVQMPDYTQNYNRYSYALNNPLRYTDPNGEEVITLASIGIAMLISAATYTAVHLVTHEFSFHGWNWGAFAGAVVAGGVGGFVAPALTSLGVGGALNGLATGAASGFAGSLTGGLINKEKGKDLWTKVALGTGIGALIGGVMEGTKAAIDKRNFINGNKTINETILVDQNIPAVTQQGTNNCLPASGEAVDASLGGGITQADGRNWFPGTSAETDPLSMRDYWTRYGAESGHRVGGLDPANIDDIPGLMNSGERIAVGLNTGGSVGHSVVLDNVVSKTYQKVNGDIFTRLYYNAMNPATGTIQTYSANTLRNAFGLVRIIP